MVGDEEEKWIKSLRNGGGVGRGEREGGQMVNEGRRGGRMDEEADKCKWG